MDYFIHPQGLCETTKVGAGTRVWAFAHVLPGATIGKECNICDQTFIENDVVLGDRVTIKCGVQVWDGVRLEDDVFVGPNASFTNDGFPRSKQYPERFAETRVCRGASIGANATILPGLTIGRAAMIGAGAVVTRSVPPNAIVVGNPAKIIGYVGTERKAKGELPKSVAFAEGERVHRSMVKDVTLHQMRLVRDMRGNLSAGEFPTDIPFTPKRYFLVFGVPSAEVRGEHAHRVCHQFLVCIHGSCSVVVDDGTHREEHLLDQSHLGLYLPPLTWGIQYRYSSDAVLLVFASEHYDAKDYIRDYEEFMTAIAEGRVG